MSVELVDVIVRGGKVVHASGVAEADIAIRDGKIVAIASEDLLPPASEYLDASGKYVLPGVVDVHNHVYLDSYRTISEAAAFGGATTLISYIWPDQSMDVASSLEHWSRFGESASIVDFGLHMGLMDTPASLEQIGRLATQGVTSFKLMMDYKRRGLMVSDEFMMAAMERIAQAGGVASVHCENGGVIHYLEEKMIAAGHTSPVDYPRSRPPMAEAEAIGRAIALAGMAGCPLYVVHVTTARGVELIAQAQAAGQPVWAEACLHYLLLTEAEYEKHGPLVKVAPPLRTEEDIQALWAAIDRGIISVVASDHVSYSREMKQIGWTNIFNAPNGFPSVEALLPLMYSEGVLKRGMPITTLVRLLSENPARVFGLYPRKGAIEVGSDADLVIFDPERESVITSDAQHSRADFTPYEGRGVRGWPVATLVRGRVVMKDGDLLDLPRHGQFLRREPRARIDA